MEVLGFSPRVFEEVRAFFESRPVFEMEQLREIAVEGPGGELVRVTAGRCLKCGFELASGDNPMLDGQGALWPADTLRAVRMTHAWDQASRSFRCGGSIMFETSPVGHEPARG